MRILYLNTGCSYLCPFLLVLVLNFPIHHSYSQNLVANPDFESFGVCPVNIGIGFLQCAPWENGNNGTSDYFNACNNPGPVGVPANIFGNQPALSGNGYTGLFVRGQTEDYYEYIQAPLTQPLFPGSTYYVSFNVNLADGFCGARHIGAYISALPPAYMGSNRIDALPQIDYASNEYLSDAANWIKISGCFIAQGDEAYITIGNFYTHAETMLDPSCNLLQMSYYYIDNVVLEESLSASVLPLDLGGPVSACNEYIILPGLDTVNLLWEDGSIEDSLIVTSSGTYTLTISDGCNKGVDSIEVVILGSPDPVDIGMDSVTICQGDSIVISFDPMWNYTWNSGAITAEVAFSTTGTYAVTMDDGCDLSADSFALMVVTPPPFYLLGADTMLCPGEVLAFHFDSTWGNFLWQDGDSSATYTISQEGNFALTVTNRCGSSLDSVEVLTGFIPFVELGPEISLCPDSTVLLNLDSLPADFIWQDGSVSSSYLLTQGGAFSVTVSNACGTDIDSLIVTEIVPPTVDVGMDITLCADQLPYTIHAIASSDVIHYDWQDGSMAASIDVNSSGDYHVTVTNGCLMATDTIHVEVGMLAPEVILPPDLTICAGDSLFIANAGSSGNYLWNDQSTDTTLLITHGGTYTLTITTMCGIGKDTIDIADAGPPLVPDLGPDFSLCVGDSFVLKPMITDVMYLWQDMSTADTFLVLHPGLYTVQLMNGCGKTNDTITISSGIVGLPLDLGPDTVSCAGDIVRLSTNVQGVNFLWQDGSTQSFLDAMTSGIYFVTASNACDSIKDSIRVTFLEAPMIFSLGPDTILCPGETLLLEAPAHQDSLEWQDGSHSSHFLAGTAQAYALRVYNRCGSVEDTLEIAFDETKPIVELDSFLRICPGDVALLNTSQSIPSTYLWNTGSVNPEIAITTPGMYSVTVSTACVEVSDETQVLLSDSCFTENSFYVPNIISPNGDGINDLFSLFHHHQVTTLKGECSIFDRWGNRVYHSTEMPFIWDGTFKHEILQPAVFAYVMHIEYEIAGEHHEQTLFGNVTVVR